MSKMLYVVGIGPGNAGEMTESARKALELSDVICGYTVYCDLVKEILPDKEYYSTTMTHEIERCKYALDLAADGKTTSIVCSGDSGVYGMAAPVLTLSQNARYSAVEIEVIPGITAAISGAAKLGAPLTHDFCVISLSDLLTPLELIEKRLRCAAIADFSVVLYNPSSKKRADYLKKACDIFMEEGRLPETVCGWVREIGRKGESSRILTLSELRDAELDMFTTVFIGSSTSRLLGGKMITPRGYQSELL